MRQAGEETNKQASKQATNRLGDAQTKPGANDLCGREEWRGMGRGRRKVQGLVTAVGEMQAGPKMEADLKQQNGSPSTRIGRQVAGGSWSR